MAWHHFILGFSRKSPPPVEDIDFFFDWISSQIYSDPLEIHFFLNFWFTPLKFQRLLLEISIDILNRGLQFLSGKAPYIYKVKPNLKRGSRGLAHVAISPRWGVK